MKQYCRRISSHLSAYIDRELPGRRAAEIEAHLAQCGECRTELRRIERVRQLVTAADPAAAAPVVDLETRVLRRIRTDAVGNRSVWPFGARWRLATVAVGCVAVVLGLAVGTALHRTAQPIRHDYPPVDITGEMDHVSEWLALAAADDEDVELIITMLVPDEAGDSEISDELLWLESPVEELVETLTSTELEDLREELYDYAIQG